MSVFRNVMVYLGLGADEEYDDDYLAEEAQRDPAPVDSRAEGGPLPLGVPRAAEPARSTPGRGSFGNPPGNGSPSAVGEVRPLRSVPAVSDATAAGEVSTARMTVRRDESGVRPKPIQRSKPRALSPQSFGDAKVLADELRKSVPVIMNLRSLDRDLARRLIDFASGSCYSLGGKMEKIAPQVFLLIPKSVEVSDDDRRRIDERGFDRE